MGGFVVVLVCCVGEDSCEDAASCDEDALLVVEEVVLEALEEGRLALLLR